MFRFSTLARVRKLQSCKRSKSSSSTKSNVRRAKAAAGGRKMEQEVNAEGQAAAALQPQPNYMPSRQWVPTKYQMEMDKLGLYPENSDQHVFTVVSYNILAQNLLQSHPELYHGIPGQYLEWQYRKACILSKIGYLQPDILCIQEIQCDHLEGFTAELQQRFTFDRIFKKRTGSEKTDGCAIFYNPDMFELLDTRTIEFNQNVTLLDRDNVGIVVKLRSRMNPNSILIVATTHLLFNPRRHDVKLAQVHVLLAEIEQMSAREGVSGGYYPIILTGDFNMTPRSQPFKLITSGELDYAKQEKLPIITKDLGITDNCQHVYSIKYGRGCKESQLYHSERSRTQKRKNEDEKLTGFEDHFNTGQLKHALHLTSTVRDLTGERASTHHDYWTIVDFLFYSRFFNKKLKRVTEGHLKLLSYLELPSVADCQRMGKIPNQFIGSDHFSLAARFLLRAPRESKGLESL